MLHLSRKFDYGLILLIELAQQSNEQKSVSVHEVAKQYFLSFLFLQKIVRDLKEKGLIASQRGQSGGYRLIKKPSEISMYEIFEAIEGPAQMIPEFQPKFNCHVPARQGLTLLNKKLRETLSGITLADFFTNASHVNA